MGAEHPPAKLPSYGPENVIRIVVFFISVNEPYYIFWRPKFDFWRPVPIVNILISGNDSSDIEMW